MVLSGRMQLVLALVVVFTGCGGGDGPTDPGSDPTGGNGNTGGRTIKDNPSFSNDVVEIFVRRGCTDGSCHGGAQGGLTLSATASVSYANLVNVPSPNESGEVRVIPGDAQNSYLVKKLEGRQSMGARMPLGGSPLDDTDLTNIRRWIDQGAQNN
jgi:hypothetical protein